MKSANIRKDTIGGRSLAEIVPLMGTHRFTGGSFGTSKDVWYVIDKILWLGTEMPTGMAMDVVYLTGVVLPGSSYDLRLFDRTNNSEIAGSLKAGLTDSDNDTIIEIKDLTLPADKVCIELQGRRTSLSGTGEITAAILYMDKKP